MERELSADVAGLVFPIPNAVRAHAERMAAALRAFFYFLFSVCEGGLQRKAPFFSVLQQTNNTQTRTHKWRLCVCVCVGGGMSGLPLRSDAAPCGRTARRHSDTKLCVRGGGCLPRPHQCLRWIVVCLRAGGSGRRRLSRYLCVRVCFIVSTRACASEKVWPRGCGGYCSVCVRAFAREAAQGRWRALLPRRWKTAFPEQICRLT